MLYSITLVLTDCIHFIDSLLQKGVIEVIFYFVYQKVQAVYRLKLTANIFKLFQKQNFLYNNAFGGGLIILNCLFLTNKNTQKRRDKGCDRIL